MPLVLEYFPPYVVALLKMQVALFVLALFEVVLAKLLMHDASG